MMAYCLKLPSEDIAGRKTGRAEISSGPLGLALTETVLYPANQMKKEFAWAKVQAGTEGQYLDFYELFTIA